MTILILCITAVLASAVANGSSAEELSEQLINDDRVKSIVDRFSDKKKSVNAVKRIFCKVHRQILSEYKQYSTIEGMLSTGNYDCLTGTALLAHIFNALDYNYEIVALDYHIYLLLDVDGEKVLLESTDPMFGYVTGKSVIAKMAEYIDDQDNKKNIKSIDFKKIPGLILYNTAVDEYNRGYFETSFLTLVSAFDYLETPKMENLLKLAISSLVIYEEISEEKLKRYLDIYLEISGKNPLVHYSEIN